MTSALPHHTKRKESAVEVTVDYLQGKYTEKQVEKIVSELLKRTQPKEKVLVGMLQANGVRVLLACGCAFGDTYKPCRGHASKSAPRVCFCGHNEELYDRTAQAYKPFTRNSEERAAPLQRERIAHFRECCRMPWQGTPEEPEAIEETTWKGLTSEEALRRIFQEPQHA